jgi:hypothetical protein
MSFPFVSIADTEFKGRLKKVGRKPHTATLLNLENAAVFMPLWLTFWADKIKPTVSYY